MRRTVAFACVALLGATELAACTPKPVDAKPVAEKYATAWQEHDTAAVAELVDNAQAATNDIDQTFAGLQAEGVAVTLKDVEQSDSLATATFDVSWDLPKDRTLNYQTQATLTKAGKEWTIRWQPSALHPELGAHQHLELRPVAAERASVVSSDGVELLTPGTQYRLLADATSVTDPTRAADAIVAAVRRHTEGDPSVPDMDPKELAVALTESRGNYSVGVFDDKQGPAIMGDLEAAGLSVGLRLNEEPALVTREKGFATDIMARVRTIVADELDGTNGWRIAVVNENGASLKDVEYHDAQPRPSIQVGIDSKVQKAAEDAVNLRADSETMLVAMRPSTGEILAVAQTPAADKKGDLALSGQFPPGSVFKIITAATGIDKQGLSPDSIVPCPGTMNIYGRVVTNYNGFSLGNVPLTSSFANSCNTTFADISTRLAPGELQTEAKRFGLGLDYDIPGLTTITGAVPVGETPLERTEAGYGQGYDLVSPFGMALVSSTVASGKRPLPKLISTATTTPSEEIDGPPPHVIDQLRTLMRATVTSGTARGMQAGGTIYGKTGEAEINGGSHAWFTGFRDDDIAFATLVVLGGGSETSVQITDHFLRNLDQLRAAPAN